MQGTLGRTTQAMLMLALGCVAPAEGDTLEPAAADGFNQARCDGTIQERLLKHCARFSYDQLVRGNRVLEHYGADQATIHLRRGTSGTQDSGECEVVLFQANTTLHYQLGSAVRGADRGARPHAHRLRTTGDGTWNYDTRIVGDEISVSYPQSDIVMICAGHGNANAAPVLLQIWGP